MHAPFVTIAGWHIRCDLAAMGGTSVMQHDENNSYVVIYCKYKLLLWEVIVDKLRSHKSYVEDCNESSMTIDSQNVPETWGTHWIRYDQAYLVTFS